VLYERGRAVADRTPPFSLLSLGSVEAIEGTVHIAADEMVAAYMPEMTSGLKRHFAGSRANSAR